MVLTASHPPQSGIRRSRAHAWTLWELALGATLLTIATLVGLILIQRPWPNRLDRVGAAVLKEDVKTHLASQLVHLGSTPVFAVGVVVVFVVALFRDRARAIACIVAPVAAVLVVEQVAKPLVGRHVGDSHAFSYPSGTVTAVAALATCALLVAPTVWKPPVTLAGIIVVSAVAAAVVILRWHYVTDALGGICVGVGAVLLIDALAHLCAESFARGQPSTKQETARRISTN